MIIVVDIAPDNAVWHRRGAFRTGDGSEVVFACGEQGTSDIRPDLTPGLRIWSALQKLVIVTGIIYSDDGNILNPVLRTLGLLIEELGHSEHEFVASFDVLFIAMSNYL